MSFSPETKHERGSTDVKADESSKRRELLPVYEIKAEPSLSVLIISSQISLCDFALCSHECLSESGGVEGFESEAQR